MYFIMETAVHFILKQIVHVKIIPRGGETGMKYSEVLIIGVTFTLIIAAMGVFLLQNDNISNEITAKEGYTIAEQHAKNWSYNATLIYVTGNSQESFIFRFWDLTNNTINCLEIKVYTNKSITTRFTKSLHDEYPISNWTLDSDEAYKIAMNDAEIESFMKHNPMLDSFFLASPTSSGDSIWYIYWAYNAGIDDPKWAQIQIDATTGEVLYVEVDD